MSQGNDTKGPPAVKRGNTQSLRKSRKKRQTRDREGEAGADLLTPKELRKAVDTGKKVEVSGYSKQQLVRMLGEAYNDTPEVEEVRVPKARRKFYAEKALERVKPLSPSQEDFMRDLVYKRGNHAGRDRLFKLVDFKYPEQGLTRRQVAKWLSEQETQQIHRPFKRQRSVAPFLPRKPWDLWLADLFEVPSEAKGPKRDPTVKRPYVAVLNVCDTFSRMCWIEALPNKEAGTVWKAFERVLERSRKAGRPDNKPNRLHVDGGGEFASVFAEGLKRRRISRSVGLAGKPWGQAIVERSNATLEHLFLKRRTSAGRKASEWYSTGEMTAVEDTYNNLPHNSLEYRTPLNVSQADAGVWKELYGDSLREASRHKTGAEGKPTPQVGDQVRLADNAKRKNPLRKGATPSWSREVYRVRKVYPATPDLGASRKGDVRGKIRFIEQYTLEDSDGDLVRGRWPGYDLQRIVKSVKAPGAKQDVDDDKATAERQEVLEEERKDRQATAGERRKVAEREAFTDRQRELDQEYGGREVRVKGEANAVTVKGSVDYNRDNDDYPDLKYPKAKVWGMTLRYADGERLWKPLFNTGKANEKPLSKQVQKRKVPTAPPRRSTRVRKQEG
jgi:transposase InsO family protein